MRNNNLNLFFNKTYYDSIPTCITEGADSEGFNNDLGEKNNVIFNSEFTPDDIIENTVAQNRFEMKTKYPGLLVGTGYAHGTGWKGVDNDINSGFSFEYVSGQPYIPASSVKGLLRSCFKHEEVITEFCEKAKGIVKELETDIFGDRDTDDSGVDIFFDAVIIKADGNKRVLGSDYITPHDSPVSDPTPILMLKILPEVSFEFRFTLKDSVIGETTITAEDKKALFIKLLGEFGIGAKTSVGYGILQYIKPKNAKSNYPAPNNISTAASAAEDVFEGVVKNIRPTEAVVEVAGKGTYTVTFRRRPALKKKVKIRITDPNGKTGKII